MNNNQRIVNPLRGNSNVQTDMRGNSNNTINNNGRAMENDVVPGNWFTRMNTAGIPGQPQMPSRSSPVPTPSLPPPGVMMMAGGSPGPGVAPSGDPLGGLFFEPSSLGAPPMGQQAGGPPPPPQQQPGGSIFGAGTGPTLVPGHTMGLVLPGQMISDNDVNGSLNVIYNCKGNNGKEVVRYLEEMLKVARQRYDNNIINNNMAKMSNNKNGNNQRSKTQPALTQPASAQMAKERSEQQKLVEKIETDNSKKIETATGSAGENEIVNTETGGSEEARPDFDAFVGDSIDSRTVTLILLVPGDLGVIGHLIGKAGSEISKIEQECHVSVRVERKGNMPANCTTERRIYVIGSVVNCTLVQQRIMARINEKLSELDDQEVQNYVKLVFPEENVGYLTNNGGALIQRINELSNSIMMVESEVNALVPLKSGRHITIHGSPANRSLAQYLLLRQLVESPTTRSEWLGGNPAPYTGEKVAELMQKLETLPQTTDPNNLKPLQPPAGPGNLIAIPSPNDLSNSPNLNGTVNQTAFPTMSPSGGGSKASALDAHQQPQPQFDPTGFYGNNSNGGMADWNQVRRSLAQQNEQILQQNQRMESTVMSSANPSDQLFEYICLVNDTGVSHLIGRKGSAIQSMQQRSGTTISFAKVTHVDPALEIIGGYKSKQGKYQQVKITGTQTGIKFAKFLLHEKLVEVADQFKNE